MFVDPERFDRVQEMWKMLLSGAYTVPKIHKVANNEWGLTTCQGRGIALSTLYHLFTRIDYTGHFYWNGVLYKGQYPAMITLDEFDRAQEILGRKGKPRPSKHEHAYTGLIECGECGCMITAEPPKTKFIKSSGQTRTYHYLRCTKKSRLQRCSQKYIRVSSLEEQIRTHLSQIHVSQDMLQWVNEKLKHRSHKVKHAAQSETSRLTKEIEDNTHKKNVLAEKLLNGKISDEVFDTQHKRLEETGLRLQQLKQKAVIKHKQVVEKTKSSFDFAATASVRFENAPKDTKKRMLLRLGSNYCLKDGKLDF